MYRFALALFLAHLPAAPGIASDDRLSRLLSAEFARQAEQHLAGCDRGNALIAALRGLPQDPIDEDFVRFEQAAQMMFRAVASRAIRIDRLGAHDVSISPNGQRVAVASFGAAHQSEGPPSPANPPPALHDAQTGARIAEFLAQGTPNLPHVLDVWPPIFSPDGRLVAIFGLRDARVYLYDGWTGAPVGVLESGAEIRSPYGPLGVGLGFSPDGRQYAGVADGVLTIWDVVSGAIMGRTSIGRVDHVSRRAVGWTHDGAILVESTQYAPPPDIRWLRSWLETWRNGQIEGAFALPALPDITYGTTVRDISRAGPLAILQTDTGRSVLLNWQSGAFFELGGVYGLVTFSRGGTAVVAISPVGLSYRDAGLAVFDLDGTPLPPAPHDYLPIDRLVCDPSGNGIGGYVPNGTRQVYAAADVPTGKALYDWVWANVPEEVRAAVSADRVMRP